MASYRPFPQSSFAPPPPPPQPQPPPPQPNQNPLPPPPPPPQHHPYPPQHRNFSGGNSGGGGGGSHHLSSNPSNFHRIPPNSNAHHAYTASSHHFNPPPPPRNQHRHHQNQNQNHQQQQYPSSFAPPPPPASSSSYSLPQPPQSSQQPPPPPPPLYYSSSSSQSYNPPPLPSSSPPKASLPPPPPPPVVPPPAPPPPPSAPPSHPSARPMHPPKQHKGPSAPPAGRSAPKVQPNGQSAKVETEEERRTRKKREFEKQRQEEKRNHMLKQSQATVLHKTQMLSGVKPHGSMAGSRMAERKTAPFLGGERIENRLKKPTTFLCKLKFRNELPDPTAQPKLLSLIANKDQYTKYTITSLEKMHKPKLYLDQDLGIPLDLLDISVYNTPKACPPLDPEDEELLRDGEVATPIKQDGIRRKDRPTDKGVSWLVKTQYISPLSTDAAKLSITEKQAKEMRETREGRNLFLENLNNREKQIQAIEESFKASKLHPVHQTNPKLEPVQILPLLPDFDRCDDRFVMVAFDGNPTADSEIYSKLDKSTRDEHESQAIMKSFVVNGSDPTKPEKFLAYMVPAPDELSKDLYEENEDMLYSWVREYHWDVRGDDADDTTTYLVNFEEDAAQYLPLPTKLVLQKKKAKEGRSGEEVEHYPVPSRVTVRRRSAVSIGVVKDRVDIVNSKRGRSFTEDDLQTQHKIPRVGDMDHFSGEEEMSD